MADGTGIAWSDATWNPVTGCTKVSPGCDHCYAETFAERFRGVPGHHFERGFDLTLRPERLDQPLRWERPRRIFVNSMSDIFHRDIPDDYIDRCYDTMEKASWHVFQVLTKRSERMMRYVNTRYFERAGSAPSHIWHGVSVESAGHIWRIPQLLKTPSGKRFVSFEPLLGLVPPDVVRGLDWIIVGGESGHGARPMDADWARALVNAAQAHGVAVFCKQLGTVLAGAVGAPGKGEDIAYFPEGLAVQKWPA